MDGTESQDELDRASIWDAIFKEGAKTAQELSPLTKIGINRVNALVDDHPWFVKLTGLVYIAKSDGRRIGPMRFARSA